MGSATRRPARDLHQQLQSNSGSRDFLSVVGPASFCEVLLTSDLHYALHRINLDKLPDRPSASYGFPERSMILPNAELALIAREKLEGYLLSESHPSGRFKAKFFRRLGFTAAHWELLEQALREQHLPCDAVPGIPNAYGQPFTINARLVGPTGASAVVISVWFLRTGERSTRLVTAYPGDSN
jgi:hypothetical protein